MNAGRLRKGHLNALAVRQDLASSAYLGISVEQQVQL